MSKKRICPDCDIELVQHMEMNQGICVTLDKCLRCGGVWLDKGELDALQEAQVHLYLTVAMNTIRQQIVVHEEKEETQEGLKAVK